MRRGEIPQNGCYCCKLWFSLKIRQCSMLWYNPCMNITVLDGYYMNPGDLSWEDFGSVGFLTVYDSTAEKDIVPRCIDSEIVLTNKVPFTRETMEQLPKLKYIGVTATGYNIIDTKAASEMGIIVTNVPEYSTEGVAESVFAHILEFTHRTMALAMAVRKGEWGESGRFSYFPYPLEELHGKTMGIVGMGHIGMRTAEIASAFGMGVIFNSRSPKPEAEEKGFKPVDLNTLFSEADYISLHVPLTDETKDIINKESLSLMKPTAILINTARGGLIDEEALAEALKDGKIAGAGLDVLKDEPPVNGSPLIHAKNCIITPHTAWAAKETRQRLMNNTLENLVSFLIGTPKNIVK